VTFKVYEPHSLAAVKQWRWALEGDGEGEVLARSPWLASREECFAAYTRIRRAFENGDVEVIEVSAEQAGRIHAARPRSA
jgi:hypothetical protein